SLALAATAPAFGQEVLPEQMRRANEAYRIGTDIGMRYLAEHAGRLRITLLLQEGDLPSLASSAGRRLPNSVDYFFGSGAAAGLPAVDSPYAAQATRAYLLAFETGVRTEFSTWLSGASRE